MKKVLLVEDEIVVAMGVEIVLEAEGYAVVLATDGRDGLLQAEREKPDLIITDFMMPRMDGLAMLARLREGGLATPAVLTTWIPKDRLPSHAQRLFDAFLPKPFSDAGLMRVVRRLTGGGA